MLKVVPIDWLMRAVVCKLALGSNFRQCLMEKLFSLGLQNVLTVQTNNDNNNPQKDTKGIILTLGHATG